MNCLQLPPLVPSLSLAPLSASFFFIDFFPFAFYCQNINAADTKPHCTLFINELPICGMRWDDVAWHGVWHMHLWIPYFASILFAFLRFVCFPWAFRLSHNSKAKFQLKSPKQSQSQSMQNSLQNWNLIALFCNGNACEAHPLCVCMANCQTVSQTDRQTVEDLPQTSHIWHRYSMETMHGLSWVNWRRRRSWLRDSLGSP